MQQIALQAVPNQTFSITLDSHDYDISINAAFGCVGVDIIRDGVAVVLGMRAVAGFPIIPYAYLEDGNFMISTINDAIPDWEQFGNTQSMLYISQDEIDALRALT